MRRGPGPRPVADGGTDAALFESFPDPLLAYVRPGEDGEGADARGASPVLDRVNAAFEATFGVAAAEVTGAPLDEVELDGTVVPRDGGHGERAGSAGDSGVPAPADGNVPDRDAGDVPDAGTAAPGTRTTVGSILERLRGDGGAVRFRFGEGGETRHFRVRTVGDGAADGGGYLLFTDVTELERRRRDLAGTVTRLERLASVARHDLRNPLEVAEIRLEAARDTGEEVHFERVAGALDRIERIVGDVLAVGGGAETTDAVDLETVVGDAWETVDTADANLVVPAELPTVRGDADHLRGLFENLFRNAVEHGGRDVTVTVEPSADGFAVVDDGPGVPEEVRERAFEAGYSTRDGGSGLGLFIVRQVAREHGWCVSLASDRDPSTGAEGGARVEFADVERAGSEGNTDGGADGPTGRRGSTGPG